jgi:hypothetical protein
MSPRRDPAVIVIRFRSDRMNEYSCSLVRAIVRTIGVRTRCFSLLVRLVDMVERRKAGSSGLGVSGRGSNWATGAFVSAARISMARCCARFRPRFLVVPALGWLRRA